MLPLDLVAFLSLFGVFPHHGCPGYTNRNKNKSGKNKQKLNDNPMNKLSLVGMQYFSDQIVIFIILFIFFFFLHPYQRKLVHLIGTTYTGIDISKL
jgi:hypothetical protein